MRALKNSLVLFALLQLALRQLPAAAQCDGSSPKPVALCLALFQAMDLSIRTNPENLYVLRTTFLPDDQPLPVLLNITYKVSFDSLLDHPCVDAEATPLFNGTQDIIFGWSLTTIYTMFHPALLTHMQIQLSVAIIEFIISGVESSGSTRAFLWDGRESLQSLTVDVSVPFFFCTPSEQQVYDTLRKINPRIQAYTRIEENSNLTIADMKYYGYTIEGSALSPTPWSDVDDIEEYSFGTAVLVAISAVALFIIVVVTIATLVYLCVRYCIHEGSANVIKDVAIQAMVRGGILKDDWLETGKEKLKTYSGKKDELVSIFWSFTFVLTYCSVGIIIAEFVKFIVWCDGSVCADVVTILKFICYIALTIFFTVLGLLFLRKPLPPPSPVLQVLGFIWCPIPLVGWLIYFCISPCGRKRVKKFQKNWPMITAALFSFLPYFTLGITAASVLIGIVPTLFMAAVYPAHIVTFYVFIVLLVTVIAVIFILLDNEDHLVTSVSCGLLALFVLIPLLVMFASGYQLFFSGGPDAFTSAIVTSLLPSLLLLLPIIPWAWRIWSVFINPEEDECKCCCKKSDEREEDGNQEAEGESSPKANQQGQNGLSSIVNSEGLHLRKPLASGGDSNVELSDYRLVND